MANALSATFKLRAAMFFSVVFFLVLTAVVFTLDKTEQTLPITLLVCAVGAISGWIFAVYVTPYDKSDEVSLDKTAKVVGSFLSGYVLSRTNGFLDKLMSAGFLCSRFGGGRICLCFCFFGLAWAVVYIFRKYI